MTKAALESGRITKAKQDGSREFISILACISAIGKWIPPLLIYKGESGDLMSTWVDEVTTDSKAHFTVSHNGWSSNAIGLAWLQQVFERYTKPPRETQKRLLIVDGHSSHVNMAFVDWADEHGVIILILPPHTTHRLQPLDVGLFQPLSTAYSWELDQMINKSGGHVLMSKDFFWGMFKRAWDKSFTQNNIQSAFRKSGIWPTNGSHIIKTITRPKLASPEKFNGLRPPTSAKAIRRFYTSYDKEPTVEKVKVLFATTLHLAAEVSVLKHERRGLYEAIDLQKKKGRQGVRLNLAGKPNKGIIDCYSPGKVVQAREYQQQKEALRIAEEEAKLQRKIQRAANALRKKQDKAKRAANAEAKAAQAQLTKDLVAANKSAKKASRKQPVSTASKAKKAARIMPIKRRVPTKARIAVKAPVRKVVVAPVTEEAVVGVAVAKTSRRTINLPQRFR
jgi:DDE superfamily endonuclease